MLGPGAVPKHLRQRLVGARWVCPLGVLLGKTGSFLQNRNDTYPQMSQGTGVMKQVTGEQWRSKNYLLCWTGIGTPTVSDQMFKGWRTAQMWKRGEKIPRVSALKQQVVWLGAHCRDKWSLHGSWLTEAAFGLWDNILFKALTWVKSLEGNHPNQYETSRGIHLLLKLKI